MRIKTLIFFLCISNLVFSQVRYDRSTWIVKGNITSLFDIVTFPTVQVSIEKRLTRYFSITPEIGYQIYNFRHTDTTFYDPHGFRANIEFRYFISQLINTGLSGKRVRYYVALQPFYTKNQYNTTISYHTRDNPTTWIDDEFGVRKNTFGMDAIFGFQKPVSDRVVVDLYGGIGVLKRTLTNTQLYYNEDSGDFMGGSRLLKYLRKLNFGESSGIYPNLVFGLKIGYML